MIVGSVKASQLGSMNFPRTVKGSWAVEDNLPEAYITSRKKELEQAKRSKQKFTQQVKHIETDLTQARALIEDK
jgi:hypothetical protein